MNYKILRTDKFNDQLFDILIYIENAFSKKDAIKYLDYIEQECLNLGHSPYLGTVPRYKAISKQGFRALVCRQNIIFYKVDDNSKTVILYAIVSSRSEYLYLI